ncbi:MAG: guanylate kinase [Methylophagaceae bacterium]|jgi:guanylate kinase
MSGSLFIVAAPSGAGKTSLVNALVAEDAEIALSVSHTTRPSRAGEIDGKDYFFVPQQDFTAMQGKGDFLESATVFDYCYGTSSEAVFKQLKLGVDVILEIDWQGAEQVRRNYPDSTSVFILPPSKLALEQRLHGRGQDDGSVISRRMRDAENEISHYIEFDYLIVNDDFDLALSQLVTIISARRHSMAIQKELQAPLLKTLLA